VKIRGAFAIAALFLCLSDQPAFSRPEAKWSDDSHRNIHTRTVINFHKSGQTVCFSHNSNNRPVRLKYDVYPIRTGGNAVHGTMGHYPGPRGDAGNIVINYKSSP